MTLILLLLARLFGLAPKLARSRGGKGAVVRASGLDAAAYLLAEFERFVAVGGVTLAPEDATWADEYLTWIERCAYTFAPQRCGAVLEARRAPLSLRSLVVRLRAATDVLLGAAPKTRSQPTTAGRWTQDAPAATCATIARALELSG